MPHLDYRIPLTNINEVSLGALFSGEYKVATFLRRAAVEIGYGNYVVNPDPRAACPLLEPEVVRSIAERLYDAVTQGTDFEYPANAEESELDFACYETRKGLNEGWTLARIHYQKGATV